MKHQILLRPLNLGVAIAILSALFLQPLYMFFTQIKLGFEADFDLSKAEKRRELEIILCRAANEATLEGQLQWVFSRLFERKRLCSIFSNVNFRDLTFKRLRQLVPGLKIIHFDGNCQIDKNRSDLLEGGTTPFQYFLEAAAQKRDFEIKGSSKGEPKHSSSMKQRVLDGYFGKESNLSTLAREPRDVFHLEDGPGHPALIAWRYIKVHDLLLFPQKFSAAKRLYPSIDFSNEKNLLAGLILLVRKSSISNNFGPKLFLTRQRELLRAKRIHFGWVDLLEGSLTKLPRGLSFISPDKFRTGMSEMSFNNLAREFEFHHLLIERKIHASTGFIYYAVTSINQPYQKFRSKMRWLWSIIGLVFLTPLGVVLLFRKNQGLSLGLNWQVVGLFALTLGLPFAVIFQLAQELQLNFRAAEEKRSFERMEETVERVTGAFELGLRRFEEKTENLANILKDFGPNPEKFEAAKKDSFKEMVEKEAKGMGASAFLIINDECKVVYTQAISGRISALKEMKATEPLLCELTRMKLEYNKIPVKGGVPSFIGAMIEQTCGNFGDIKEALKRADRAFPLKIFNKTLFINLFLVHHDKFSDSVSTLIVAGGAKQFEEDFLEFFLSQLYEKTLRQAGLESISDGLPEGVEIFALPTDAKVNEWFIPAKSDFARYNGYEKSKFDEEAGFRMQAISWAQPTLTGGLTVRENNFSFKDRRLLFQSIKPMGFEQSVLVLFFNYSLIEEKITRKWRMICLNLAFSVLIAILLGMLFSRGILAPVKKLGQGVSFIANSEYDTRIMLPGKDEMVELAESFNEMANGLWERAKMSRYLSRAALEAVKEAAETKLWGEQISGTILFCDIRSFTTIAEGTDPLGVVKLLNEYFSRMAQVIFSHDGDISKFIGDAIMAIFKPSKEHPEPEYHSHRAVFCGLEMMEALDALNKQRKAYNQIPITIGIGINSGDLISGNIGAPGRMEHSVIGDNVNIARELNKLSRFGRHTRVIISRTTFDLAKGSIEAEKMQLTSIKGKTHAVEMYEVIRRCT